MGKHFAIARRKTRLAAFVTAVILGIGVGVIAASGVLLAFKLTGKDSGVIYYIASGALAVLASLVSYLAFMPSEKKLAKRLDEEHGLDEKVRTMIQFKHSDDAFMKLQREDADEKLGKVKIVPWRKKQLLAAILVLVMSVGCFTGAIAVPRMPDGSVEPPMSDFDKQLVLAELAELVHMVETSLVEETLKADTLSELKSLVEFVKTHEYMSEMKSKAIQTVLNTSKVFNKINSATKIGACFADSSISALKELGVGLSEISGTKSKKALEAIWELLISSTAENFIFVSDEISSAMRSSGITYQNNLASLLSNLASALRVVPEGEMTAEQAFGDVISKVSSELMVQNINKRVVQDQVIPKLCEIFNITSDDLAEFEGGGEIETEPPKSELPPLDEDDTEAEEPDAPIGGGGMGTGDLVYGSNDVIYDPYTNTYVAYGTLLAEYNAKAIDMLEDGKIPPDFSDFVNEYFKTLSEYKPEGGTDDKQ